ncbi:unnamed protein product [Rangifer tarandus platyrhynchus]|uniref:Uncharacterized protein n=1 Tax=Rangifer tarandus platyrhynchus TaxID=3082113 RepID=A0ABN8ZNG6_RANTA|nr:unnamed protein product [Rangifer tarandus platyrhynchus]
MRGSAGSQSLRPLGRARAASAVSRMETPQPARPLSRTRPSGGLPSQGRGPGGSASAPAPRPFSRPPAARTHHGANLNARQHGHKTETTRSPRPEPTRACTESTTPRAGGPREAPPMCAGHRPGPRRAPSTFPSLTRHPSPASPQPRLTPAPPPAPPPLAAPCIAPAPTPLRHPAAAPGGEGLPRSRQPARERFNNTDDTVKLAQPSNFQNMNEKGGRGANFKTQYTKIEGKYKCTQMKIGERVSHTFFQRRRS